jgi:signal transduction histidine kinase
MSHAAALETIADDPASRGWDWQVDDQMRFGNLHLSATRIGHAVPEDGDTFTAFFALADSGAAENGQRAMPMVEALVRHMNFESQLAYLRGDPEVRYRLSGTALFDRSGTFSGYRGHAQREEIGQTALPQTGPVPAPLPQQPIPDREAQAPEGNAAEFIGPALSRRLDTALRQPITRIIANAGTIGERVQGPLRQDYANYAGDIAAEGRHLLALVDDLADLQAVEGPGFITNSEEVDLSEIARRAAGLLNIRADARRIVIQAPGADEQVFAQAEYRRVLQILVNLVGNAVRHSPEESTIWIRLDEVNGRAHAVVADQGNGIDGADHERIFERFERLGNTDGDGSGLGLYISRKLARAMGGDVTVESALGRGARFMLDLPAWSNSRSGTRTG